MDVESALSAEIRAAGDRFEAREAADPDRYPAESVAELVALGLFSAPFPRELGGAGLDLPSAVVAIEALSAASPSLGLLASMPVGLAGVLTASAPALPEALRPAFREQVARVAGDYGAGGICAACNSEKGAGGSIDAIRTVARRDGEGYRLTGEKILASFGQHATTFFSTAKLPEGGVELFFVDTGQRASPSARTGTASGCAPPRATRCATTTRPRARCSGIRASSRPRSRSRGGTASSPRSRSAAWPP